MDIRKTAFYIYTIFLFLQVQIAGAQVATELVPLSGMVVDKETLNPIPHVTVKNASMEFAVLADSTGFFSMTVNPGDTIIFEAMLYRQETYIVPEENLGGRFAIIEAMQKDKLLLEEVTVRAFPSQQQFERMFLAIDPGNIAEKTIVLNEHLDDISEDPTNMQQYILDYYNHYVTYIITDNAPPNNFLNPDKWVEFIRNWREGVFTEDAVENLPRFPDPDPNELEDDRRLPEPVLVDP